MRGLAGQPIISIIIPTHRRDGPLAHLLNSLVGQSLPTNQFEILVIANTRAQPTKRVIDSFRNQLPNLNLFVSRKIGVNCARNMGIDLSSGSILLFLDDDCEIVSPLFLENTISWHQRHPDRMALGGPYLLKGKAVSAATLAYHLNMELWYEWDLDGKLGHLLGGNTSYKREVFLRGFRFDDEIVFGGAETEFNLRLLANGMRFGKSQDVPVYHNCKLSLTGLTKKAYLQGKGARRQGEILADHPWTSINLLENKLKTLGENYGFFKTQWVRALLRVYSEYFSRGYLQGAK